MTDISSDGASDRRFQATAHAKSSTRMDEVHSPAASDLVACAELFYFAYRDFTGDPDAILANYGFGRAHHRVLHFVYRHPGLKVAELLEILKITKQSLARVLKQLVDEGFIIQRAGDEDRRERRLYVSAKGARLTDKLTQIQIKRLEQALKRTGSEAEAHVRGFLSAMIADQDRPRVEMLIGTPCAAAASGPRGETAPGQGAVSGGSTERA